MRFTISFVSLALLSLVSSVGCNQILGIEQGHYPDGGLPSDNGAADAGNGGAPGSAGSRGDGGASGDAASPGGECSFPVAGTYDETETPVRDGCGGTAKSTSTISIGVTGSSAILTIDGKDLPDCPAMVNGCVLHWECMNAGTGVTITTDLTFDAKGFSGALTEANTTCSVLVQSVGVRR